MKIIWVISILLAHHVLSGCCCNSSYCLLPKAGCSMINGGQDFYCVIHHAPPVTESKGRQGIRVLEPYMAPPTVGVVGNMVHLVKMPYSNYSTILTLHGTHRRFSNGYAMPYSASDFSFEVVSRKNG